MRTGFGGGPIGGYEDPAMGGIFGGQRASGANDMVNAMMGGMEASQSRREEEQKTAALWQDWQRIFDKTGSQTQADRWVEQQQSTKWGGPWGGPQWPPKPGDPWPPTGGPPWGPFGPVAERSSDFRSDSKGQQRLMDAIKIKNPGLGEEELMILFQQAYDKALS